MLKRVHAYENIFRYKNASMREGSYSKANSCLADQEVLHLSQKRSSLLYSKEPATGPYLSQINPVHILTLCIHDIIIPPPSTPRPLK
jgi:hypothetical protein